MATAKSTWEDLWEAFELEMERMVANKSRGAGREEGIMSLSTRSRYRQTIRHFTSFLEDSETPVNAIEPSTIEKYKVDRHKKIVALKQARGGSRIALDMTALPHVQLRCLQANDCQEAHRSSERIQARNEFQEWHSTFQR
jgi:hypothetical protein